MRIKCNHQHFAQLLFITVLLSSHTMMGTEQSSVLDNLINWNGNVDNSWWNPKNWERVTKVEVTDLGRISEGSTIFRAVPTRIPKAGDVVTVPKEAVLRTIDVTPHIDGRVAEAEQLRFEGNEGVKIVANRLHPRAKIEITSTVDGHQSIANFCISEELPSEIRVDIEFGKGQDPRIACGLAGDKVIKASRLIISGRIIASARNIYSIDKVGPGTVELTAANDEWGSRLRIIDGTLELNAALGQALGYVGRISTYSSEPHSVATLSLRQDHQINDRATLLLSGANKIRGGTLKLNGHSETIARLKMRHGAKGFIDFGPKQQGQLQIVDELSIGADGKKDTLLIKNWVRGKTHFLVDKRPQQETLANIHWELMADNGESIIITGAVFADGELFPADETF